VSGVDVAESDEVDEFRDEVDHERADGRFFCSSLYKRNRVSSRSERIGEERETNARRESEMHDHRPDRVPGDDPLPELQGLTSNFDREVDESPRKPGRKNGQSLEQEERRLGRGRAHNEHSLMIRHVSERAKTAA